MKMKKTFTNENERMKKKSKMKTPTNIDHVKKTPISPWNKPLEIPQVVPCKKKEKNKKCQGFFFSKKSFECALKKPKGVKINKSKKSFKCATKKRGEGQK